MIADEGGDEKEEETGDESAYRNHLSCDFCEDPELPSDTDRRHQSFDVQCSA